MAIKITEDCINCGACEPECPNEAITEGDQELTAERRAPRYKPTLVDPYGEHLRRRRPRTPRCPSTHLLRESKELGYTGSANLLVRYLTQGRAEGDRPVTTPQRFARLLLTRPENCATRTPHYLGNS